MSGPTHSNRNYKVMKGYSLPEGEYIIEEWNASNWDKETKETLAVAVCNGAVYEPKVQMN